MESLTRTRYTVFASQSCFRRDAVIERTEFQSFRRISYPPVVSGRKPDEYRADFCGDETRIRASRIPDRCFWTARTTSASGGVGFISVKPSHSRMRRTRGTSSELRSAIGMDVGWSALRTYSHHRKRSGRDQPRRGAWTGRDAQVRRALRWQRTTHPWVLPYP
jgi:hypothetical protein